MINREKYQSMRVMSFQEIAAETDREDFDPDAEGWLFGVGFSIENYTTATFLERPSIFKFDDIGQRVTDAWSQRKRSEAVASILMNIELGPIKAQRKLVNKTKYRNVVDGGNRLTCIKEYERNLWPLEPDTYIFGQQGEERFLVDLSGAFFRDLPKLLRNRFMSYPFSLHLYDIDDEMKDELVYRWNNYEVHSSAEAKRAHMSAIMKVTINDMMKLDFARIGFKDAEIKRSLHMEPLLQGLALLETDNNTILDQDAINDMLHKNLFSAETISLSASIAQYLEEVYQIFIDKEMHKESKKIFQPKHKPTLIYIAAKALERLGVETFAVWAKRFFLDEIDETGYKKSGGDKRLNKVQSRNQIALDHFMAFANTIKIA